MLQTRSDKRTAKAALKIAVEMAEAGTISRDEAVMRVEPASLDQWLHRTLDPDAPRDLFATGLPASPYAAQGAIVFASAEAEQAKAAGRCVVRVETSPEDITGMHADEGILTTRGGMTSHAAVVARGMGKPCVSGAGAIRVDTAARTVTAHGVTLKAGDTVSLDGGTGEVFRGTVPMREPELSGDFARLLEWANGARRMKVRTNAETPLDAITTRSYGT